jgi:hypothetical protein
MTLEERVKATATGIVGSHLIRLRSVEQASLYRAAGERGTARLSLLLVVNPGSADEVATVREAMVNLIRHYGRYTSQNQILSSRSEQGDDVFWPADLEVSIELREQAVAGSPEWTELKRWESFDPALRNSIIKWAWLNSPLGLLAFFGVVFAIVALTFWRMA